MQTCAENNRSFGKYLQIADDRRTVNSFGEASSLTIADGGFFNGVNNKCDVDDGRGTNEASAAIQRSLSST
jgi:hypothetical protein